MNIAFGLMNPSRPTSLNLDVKLLRVGWRMSAFNRGRWSIESEKPPLPSLTAKGLAKTYEIRMSFSFLWGSIGGSSLIVLAVLAFIAILAPIRWGIVRVRCGTFRC